MDHAASTAIGATIEEVDAVIRRARARPLPLPRRPPAASRQTLFCQKT
jgi:hypothetical protein